MKPAAAWDQAVDRFRLLPERDRRALLLGALLLVPLLLWAGVVRPYRATMDDVQDRLVSERALLAREKAVLQEAPTLPSRLEAAREAMGRWEARFVRSANPALAEAEVTATLERVARESRVLLEEVRTVALPPGAAAPAGLMPLRLSVRGESDFEGVLRFLHGLEQNPLLLRVIGLSLDPASGGGGGGRGGGAGPQQGAMAFVVIVEAFVPEDPAHGAGGS